MVYDTQLSMLSKYFSLWHLAITVVCMLTNSCQQPPATAPGLTGYFVKHLPGSDLHYAAAVCFH